MSTIQVRRGTAAEATSNNPTLAAGEVGFETDTGRFKIGDGSTAWTSLPYAAVGDVDFSTAPSSGDALVFDGTSWVPDSTTYGPLADPFVGLLANRPAASAALAGAQFKATDVDGGTTYLCNGSSWEVVARGLDSVRYVIKSADETLNNDATLQDDDELLMPVDADSVYEVTGLIIYSASSSADLRCQFSTPSAADSIDWSVIGAGANATTLNSATMVVGHRDRSQPATLGGVGAGTKVVAQVSGLLQVDSTAGNLTFRWRQDAAEASDTVVHAGSWMRLEKVF